MGTGKKRIIPKVRGKDEGKYEGRRTRILSHLMRKNLGNRERQEPAGVFIFPQSKEKEGMGNGAMATSQ